MSAELCEWLRANSSGIYRPARDAADLIEHLTARAEAAEAEVVRLRQGLWDCFAESGGDTDGDKTPAALTSDIVRLAVDGVRDLRECYSDQMGEVMVYEAGARRYRWLRHGDNDEKVLQFFDTSKCGTDDCWLLREDELDEAIDAELSLAAELAKEAK